MWNLKKNDKNEFTYRQTHRLRKQTSGYQRGNVGERDKLGGESRTIKKAEHQRIEATELWCWRRLLRVPSTARR